MTTDNPFAPGSDPSGPRGDVRDAVPMDIQPILERCWEILVTNPGTVVGTLLVPIVPALVVGGIDGVMQVVADGAEDETMLLTMTVGRLGLNLLNTAIGVFFQLGTAAIFLRLARGEEAEIGMLLGEGGKFLSGLGASILMGIAILFGVLLFIVPGVILGLGLQFTMYAIVDKDLGPIDALQESWRLTDGYKLTIFVLNLVFGIISLAAICMTLGLGWFIVAPLMALVQAVMYHSLTRLQGS